MSNFDQVRPQTVRFWAWVDSGIVLALGIPPLAERFIALLYRINGALGGTSSAPAFHPIQMFFVALSGALVAVWVVARLLHPTGLMAVVDGVGRLWVSGLILYFVLAKNAPGIILAFVLTEAAGALAQLSEAYRKALP